MLPNCAEGRKRLSLTFKVPPQVDPKTYPKINPDSAKLRAPREIRPRRVSSMAALNGKPMFPCPVCTQAREVRVTKKR
jgi:hypothetical protein